LEQGKRKYRQKAQKPFIYGYFFSNFFFLPISASIAQFRDLDFYQ